MPGTAARTLACAADLFARVRKLRYDGIAIASRIPRMMITTRSSISVKPLSSLVRRCRKLCIRHSLARTAVAGLDRPPMPAVRPPNGGGSPPRAPERKRKGAVSRALVELLRPGLAGAELDVARRAGLVVLDGRRRRVDDAVAAKGRDGDLDVLDPGVVRALEFRQRRARVARGVVGVERLHAGHCSADVGLRSGLVGPRAEAQVRGDRDRQQDPENDDHDQQLDEGETLVAPQSLLKPCKHACSSLRGCADGLTALSTATAAQTHPPK